jgi:hypothetical protein
MACTCLCHDVACTHIFKHPCHASACRPAPETEHQVRWPSHNKPLPQNPRDEVERGYFEVNMSWPEAVVIITVILVLAYIGTHY